MDTDGNPEYHSESEHSLENTPPQDLSGDDTAYDYNTHGDERGRDAGNVLKISDSQFGKKVGKHAEDFGLDPSNPASRDFVRGRTNEIFTNKTEIRQGLWRGQGEILPNGANTSGQVNFYIQGKDVVVTDLNGNFITIMKDGINNPRVMDATKIWP